MRVVIALMVPAIAAAAPPESWQTGRFDLRAPEVPCSEWARASSESDDPKVAREAFDGWRRCQLGEIERMRIDPDAAAKMAPRAMQLQLQQDLRCAGWTDARLRAVRARQPGEVERLDEKLQQCNLSGARPDAKRWRLDGANGCFHRDAARAREALRHLAPLDRQFLRYVCGRNGITLPDGPN